MAGIQDHGYAKLCAEIASTLSISIAAARRQVEIAASKEGLRELADRKLIAERILNKARSSSQSDAVGTVKTFDELLAALQDEDNFMVED